MLNNTTEQLDLLSPTDDIDATFSFLSLERCISNPLFRGISNISATSQEGNAHLVPFGRGHEHIAANPNIDFSETNQIIISPQNNERNDQPTFPGIMMNEIPSTIPTQEPFLINMPQIMFPVHPPQTMQIPFPAVPNPMYPTDQIREIQGFQPHFNHINNDNDNDNTRNYMNNIEPMQPTEPATINNDNNNNNNNDTQQTNFKYVAPKIMLNNDKIITKNTKSREEAPGRINKKQEKPKINLSRMEVTNIIKMNLSLEELLNGSVICKFIKHQSGSRYVQERISKSSKVLIDRILHHIIFDKNDIVGSSEDIYGNYVIQIFFEIGNQTQRKLLIDHLLKGNVYKLSRSLYGCRVIQKAFDYISKEETIKLVSELNNDENIKQCITDSNANHVIQKMLTLGLDKKCVECIINCVDRNICFYASHKFGCRIVQNIIAGYQCNTVQTVISKSNLLNLCKSQYGNYVIQDILQIKQCKNIKGIVIKNVFENVLKLSKNKYGSNVVEKCLINSNEKEKEILLTQIKKKRVLIEMVNDKFANYVIQKLLDHLNEKQQNRFIHQIETNIPNLTTTNYGKHIRDKIKKIKANNNYYHHYNHYKNNYKNKNNYY